MRNLRTLAAAMGGVVGAFSALSAVVVGCGDDTLAPIPEVDAHEDRTTDGAQEAGRDVAPDITVPDGGDGGVDGGDGGGDGGDGGVDGGDGGGDGGVDGAVDAAESGISQALLDYPKNWATAFCARLGTCCQGADASAWDIDKCVKDNMVNGVLGTEEYTLPEALDVVDGGHLVFDQDASVACMTALSFYSCPTFTSVDWSKLTRTCFATLHGDIPVGQGPCRSNFECVENAYCARLGDGGLACAALRDAGQPCDMAPRETACSYLGSGNTGLFCDRLTNPDGGAVCKPLLANGASCADPSFTNYFDNACQALLCGDDGKCGTNATSVNSAFCAFYKK